MVTNIPLIDPQLATPNTTRIQLAAFPIGRLAIGPTQLAQFGLRFPIQKSVPPLVALLNNVITVLVSPGPVPEARARIKVELSSRPLVAPTVLLPPYGAAQGLGGLRCALHMFSLLTCVRASALAGTWKFIHRLAIGALNPRAVFRHRAVAPLHISIWSSLLNSPVREPSIHILQHSKPPLPQAWTPLSLLALRQWPLARSPQLAF